MITLRPSQEGAVNGEKPTIEGIAPGEVREYENREYPDKQGEREIWIWNKTRDKSVRVTSKRATQAEEKETKTVQV